MSTTPAATTGGGGRVSDPYQAAVETEGERLQHKREQIDSLEVSLQRAGYSLLDFGQFLNWRDAKNGSNGQGKPGRQLHLTSITELLNAPPVEYLIDNVLFDRSFSILGGYTGIGKSMLAMSIAKSVADGFPLFGRYKVNRTGPVLIVDEENSHSDLRDRLIGMKIPPDGDIHFLSFQGVLLDDEQSFGQLMDMIVHLDPVLTIFDSLVRFHRVNENDASEMSRVMARFREITNTARGVLVQHHHNKGLGAMEVRSRGSSDIVGICDVEYALSKFREDELIFQSVKSRRARIDPVHLRIEDKNGELLMRCLGTEREQSRDRQEAVLDALADGPLTVTELSDHLCNSGYPVSEKIVREILNRLTEVGRVEKKTLARNRKQYAVKG